MNWFWRVEDLFKEKNIWTSVNDIISDQATQESDEKMRIQNQNLLIKLWQLRLEKQTESEKTSRQKQLF